MRRASVVAVIALWAAACGETPSPSPSPSPSSAASASGTREITMRDRPNYIVVTADAVWVTETGAGSVARIDPATGVVAQRIEVGDDPGAIVASGGRLWIALDGGSLVVVDPVADRVEATIDLPATPSGLAVGAGAIWVASGLAGAVYKVDPGRRVVVSNIPVRRAEDVAAAGDQVWVAGPERNTVSRIDPADGSIVSSVEVPGGVHSLALHDGSLWVGAGSFGDAVSRIDTATASLVATVQVEPKSFPDRFAFSGNNVYVGQYRAAQVLRIDAATNRVVGRLATGDGPAVVAFGFDSLWVANFDSGTVLRVPA